MTVNVITLQDADAIAGKKSIVLIEQPEAGRIGSRRFSEHLPRPAFFPDSDPPRLGHFPDPLLNRLEFLLTRLLDPTPFGPELAPFGAPLFRVRTFDVGVAGSREGVPWRSGFFSGLFGWFLFS